MGSAVAIPFVVAGVLVLLGLVRPGMGIALLVVAVALFAAGGTNDRHRLLWVPFAVVGAFLAALNFTPVDVPAEPTGIALCGVALGALLIGLGWDRFGGRFERV